MSTTSPRERFRVLTAKESAHGWRVLGAIAAEQALERSTLLRLGGTDEGRRSLDDWLREAVAKGLLVEVGPARGLTVSSVKAREALFAVHPELEQRVLREVERRQELQELARETQALLEARSVSALSAALQRGELGAFQRSFAKPRLPRPVPEQSAAEWLRASLCEPFDGDWLEGTWKRQAPRVVARVLAESLDGPSRCDGLVTWATSYLRDHGGDDGSEPLVSALCQHAIFRGETAAIGPLAAELPAALRLGFQAAARFLEGELPAAQRHLDAALESGSRSAPPSFGAAAPLLSLLLLGRDIESATASARRVISAATGEGQRGTGTAFRMLLRYLEQPSAEHRRIAVHQLEPGAGAWELLLSGLNVHLHVGQPTTRASWAQHLTRKALSWTQTGYLWLAKQTLWLARELSEEHNLEELRLQAVPASVLAPLPRELCLWDLVAPKPEWKKALLALAEISEVFTERADLAHRAAWFLDMSDGSFARPALQEYRPEGDGWTQGQRMTISELYERREGLPPEDLRVLEQSREIAEGRRELTLEAYEALIGHPRVWNGARARGVVEVVRGTCRVETEEDGGYIRVVVEPEGAELGVNVVPESDSRLVVYRVSKAMRRVIEVLPRGVRIPKEHEPEVLRILAQLAQSVEVRSPHLGVERTVVADATPCLRLSPHAGAWLVQAGVRPFGAKGRFLVAGAGTSSITYSADGQRLRAERDLDLERTRLAALISLCPSLLRDPDEQEEAARAQEEHAWVLGETAVLSLLSELRDGGSPCELEWPESGAMKLRGTVSTKSLHGRLRSQKGWYIATGGIDLDDVTEVALRELVYAPAVAGGRFRRLANGDYVELEEKIRGVVAALAAGASPARSGGELRIHPGAVATLGELAEEASGFDVGRDVAAWLALVDDLATREFPLPEGLRAELRPYQLDGFRWLSRLAALGLGACLADDMGLGKTVQIIALLLTRVDEGPALVVAPTSVCHNWVLELERFAPSLVPVEYGGKDRKKLLASLAEGRGKVLITSYALLQQDEAELCALSFGTAVLDEAQFIKNAESLRARAAFRLTAKQRIAATGTPVENHYGDLWSIFHFLSPGLLGDWKSFKRRFVLPSERDGNEAPEAALRRLVLPYVLRRLKRDVLPELPPLTEVQHDVHLSDSDTLRYGLLRKQIHEKLFTAAGKRDNKLEVLAELTRLRRFCCHPKLVFPTADSESAKLESFLDLVTELRENQHRALVFSQYVDFLSLVREALDEQQITYEYLDGGTPKAERKARVEAFQNGNASLFLISLKAGGFGLNLTAADYVIHLDPWWNPAVEAQATDRAHRIGQERRVTVYRLITKGTIEEKLVALHREKQRLARSLLDGSAAMGELEMGDLLGLLGDEPDHEAGRAGELSP
jgi:superfamily II DNA or RNA helicase